MDSARAGTSKDEEDDDIVEEPPKKVFKTLTGGLAFHVDMFALLESLTINLL